MVVFAVVMFASSGSRVRLHAERYFHRTAWQTGGNAPVVPSSVG